MPLVVVPIGVFTESNICDGLATVTGDKSYGHAARISLAIGLAGSAAAVATGLRD